ncbi:MAG TPA: response regulator transcription factor [Actinomycetota bacterium]|nr:response regulator transcription factor [Actinomycetota bacterium]
MSAIRVMVVDDHEMIAQSLSRVLGDEADIQVVGTVGSVSEVAHAAVRLQPDVVIMDYKLADGTGIDATERLRSVRPEAKVVLLTGFADDGVLLAAIEAGCSGFITKDQPATEIVSAIRAAQAGEALISPAMLSRLLPRIRKERTGFDPGLTPRELEVLQLLSQGLTSQAIAERLVLSPHTVRNHIQSILPKLGAHSKLEAVAIAVREGVITMGPDRAVHRGEGGA